MCRVPAGPPPAALYEAPTWLDEGADDTALPAPAGLLQAGAPLPPSNDADADLLDSLLLGTGGEVAAPKAEPVVKAEPPPLPVVASRAFAPAPAHAPAFLAGMFAGLPYTPTGLVSHAAAAQLAASLPKRPSSFPDDDDDDGDDDATGDTNVDRVKKRRRESAQRSRARKSAFVRALEVENAALRAAVGHLEATLATLTGRPGGESAVTAAAAAAAAIARQAPPIVTPGGTAGSAYHQHATHTATHAPARADSSAASGASTPGAARAADAAAAAARAAVFGGMVPV